MLKGTHLLETHYEQIFRIKLGEKIKTKLYHAVIVKLLEIIKSNEMYWIYSLPRSSKKCSI